MVLIHISEIGLCIYHNKRYGNELYSKSKLIKPNGPYCLAGWSFGGIVALEMARQ